MFAHLRGTIGKGRIGEVSVDVSGVGYRVVVPLNMWDDMQDGETAMLWISTYVREDRLELFGFASESTRMLFEELTGISGVGPRMGIELCSVPRGLLLRAIQENNFAPLSAIKGVGRKTAEKLLVELKSLAEREPHLFTSDPQTIGARFDPDAVAVLVQLGYKQQDIVHALEAVPQEAVSTEERVAAALRSL